MKMKDDRQTKRQGDKKTRRFLALSSRLLASLSPCLLFFLLTFAVSCPWLPAQELTDEPPLTGRPADFSQIVGQYSIRSKASPREVFLEDPISLEISITGQGPEQYQPRYRNLHECLFPKEAEEQFYIEPIPKPDEVVPFLPLLGANLVGTTASPLSDGPFLAASALIAGRPHTWKFDYRLRPKTTTVQTLPRVRLSFYQPERGMYQTAYADDEPPISVVVKPKRFVQPADVGLTSIEAPERFYQLIKGEGILGRETVRPYWTKPLLFLGTLGPPLLIVILFISWRRLFPDAGRKIQRRRSQAARRTVKELGRAKREQSSERLVTILTGYLCQRLDFSAVEATPAEIAQCLRRRGVSWTVLRRWAELFRVCDAVRFAPSQGTEKELRPLYVSAVGLVNDLEGDPCLANSR